MNKKLTRKEKQTLHQQSHTVSRRQQEQQEKSRRSLTKWLGILVALAGLLVYSNTISNKYVLDDWGLIPENKLTRKGFDGIGEIFRTSYRTGMDITDYSLYRPLSKATFAVEWDLSPDNPVLPHTVNILLFALLCWTLFRVLVRSFNGSLLVPFLTALLFAVHPIHTEVVANIKSRDEILSLLLLLFSWQVVLTYAGSGKVKALLSLSVLFFFALLAKESSITWLAVMPLILYFFTNADRGKYLPVFLSMAVPAALFLLIRRSVLGNVEVPIPVIDNHLSGIPDFLTQRTSAIAILGIYFYKFFIPYPLMADASYNHFKPVGAGDWQFLLPFVLFLALMAYAIRTFRKKDPVSFSILFFFATVSIVSNVVVLIGTNYAERLLFTPSLGWCLALSVLLSRLLGSNAAAAEESERPSDFFKRHLKPVALVLLTGLVFSCVTLARNRDWYDNLTLYTTDLKKVPDSGHMRFYLANHISSEEYLSALPDSATKVQSQMEAIRQLDTAIQIYPNYADAFQRRAFIHYSLKDYKKAEPDFKRAIEINPTQPVAHNNYGNLLFNSGRFPEAMEHIQLAVKYNPSYSHALNNLASTYGVYGENERRLSQEDPANRSQHLANAQRNFELAIEYFKKAIQADPEYATPYYLLGVTYRNLGDESQANKYIKISEEIKKVKRYNAGN